MHKFFIFAALLVTACNSMSSQNEAIVDKENNMVDFSGDHDEMNAAIEKAKKTFPFFVENWKTLPNDGYSLKIEMPTDDGSVEHIWFNPISIEGDSITAECANDPRDISGLQLGDVRVLNKSQVSDWMIIAGNDCYGGFTLQVTIKASPEMKAQIPYNFVEPK